MGSAEARQTLEFKLICAYTISTISLVSRVGPGGYRVKHTIVDRACVGNGRIKETSRGRVGRNCSSAHTRLATVGRAQHVRGTDPIIPLGLREYSPFLSNPRRHTQEGERAEKQ